MNRSVAEALAARVSSIEEKDIPEAVRKQCQNLVVDIGGLCIAARNSDYIAALKKSLDVGGACTAIGHTETFSAEDAAMLNGTAAHGEDFDDTFEGGPVHSGAPVVPAVLAACERFGRDGRSALLGIAAGVETMCRLSLVAPKRIHDAGFHPTAVLGALAAAVSVSKTMNLNEKQTVHALGIAGSMAGGLGEYLVDGAWTKRLHPGWAAHCGLHAARLAKEGFTGPRTVLEGKRGVFAAFARDSHFDFEKLNFKNEWLMTGLTFKPYATGTMNQPYIDCALRLARRGFAAEDEAQVLCETAEGYVQRLWEPLAAKHRPPSAYAAKFSVPFNIAVAFVTGGAGFAAFSEKTVADPRVLGLAAKVRYAVDPKNPYPHGYTGHVRVTLEDGRVFEERQPHIRGGASEPLKKEELESKFRANAAHGGWPEALAREFLKYSEKAFDAKVDLAPFRA